VRVRGVTEYGGAEQERVSSAQIRHWCVRVCARVVSGVRKCGIRLKRAAMRRYAANAVLGVVCGAREAPARLSGNALKMWHVVRVRAVSAHSDPAAIVQTIPPE